MLATSRSCIMLTVGDLLLFEVGNGTVLVEERSGADLERAGLLDRIGPAKQRLEAALGQIAPAAEAALRAVRNLSVPDEVELEPGVPLTAEAGAALARTTAEAHLIVRVKWSPGAAPNGSGDEGPEGGT